MITTNELSFDPFLLSSAMKHVYRILSFSSVARIYVLCIGPILFSPRVTSLAYHQQDTNDDPLQKSRAHSSPLSTDFSFVLSDREKRPPPIFPFIVISQQYLLLNKYSTLRYPTI